MVEADKPNFKRMMNALMEIYYKPQLSNAALFAWWGKLEKYEFEEVNKAFDTYTNTESRTPPMPADILKICQHKVTIHARLPSPLSKQANAEYAHEVVEFVRDKIKPKRDMREWAKKIIESPKKYPDIAVRFAKEALNMEEA